MRNNYTSIHEATRQLSVLDASRENQLQKADQRDAQTSPIKTFAEPSTSLEYTSLAERTSRLHETTRDENVNKDGGELPGRHLQSTWSVFETAAKRTRMKAKSPVHREWKSMRQRVLSLTQQVAALKSAKESFTKQVFSNEKLQNELNQSQQRAKISKQTVEVTRRNFSA